MENWHLRMQPHWKYMFIYLSFLLYNKRMIMLNAYSIRIITAEAKCHFNSKNKYAEMQNIRVVVCRVSCLCHIHILIGVWMNLNPNLQYICSMPFAAVLRVRRLRTKCNRVPIAECIIHSLVATIDCDRSADKPSLWRCAISRVHQQRTSWTT